MRVYIYTYANHTHVYVYIHTSTHSSVLHTFSLCGFPIHPPAKSINQLEAQLSLAWLRHTAALILNHRIIQICLPQQRSQRQKHMEVSINGGYPKMDGLQWKLPFKWKIWGYPHFRKPPYEPICFLFSIISFLFFFSTIYCRLRYRSHGQMT